jgi:threonylcarbamoyladenosine tRNA methylthiotransferase MtaB
MVLSSMGRGCTWEQYMGIVGRLAAVSPGSLIGADVIVGYPTEGGESFETTYSRIEASPINYLHVFSYSPRPGTRAYALGDPVQGSVKRERSLRLRELAAAKNRAFRETFVGEVLTIVAEYKDGAVSGLADNYIRVNLGAVADAPAPGSAVRVRITGVDGGSCRGVLE